MKKLVYLKKIECAVSRIYISRIHSLAAPKSLLLIGFAALSLLCFFNSNTAQANNFDFDTNHFEKVWQNSKGGFKYDSIQNGYHQYQLTLEGMHYSASSM